MAYGAAVMAGILSNEEETHDLVLWDVIPATLGIEVVGDIMSNLVARNSRIPLKETGIYTTTKDNQRTVTIQV